MKMTFRGKEDVATKTTQTPFSEAWYQDLKDVPSIELPKKALVGAGMSLFWWMDREDKPVYMEDGKRWSDGYYPKKADEELWYLRIVKNFALPRDEDLAAQPPTGAVVHGEKCQRREERYEKKGTRHSSDSWCDYVVVSDSLEGLAPVVVKKPKAEPWDAADIPALNADDPIDLESSPEPLLKTKTGK
ncbi:putative adenosine/AMP deaminase active [Helianthus annuus]|uniref:Adenosine/AMP deaminase active n=1 Tax=Helianthus annuus TaxID=4232 RepID=A0A9K3E5X2_HELAN|nr:putative adenosine/AMP deaminase active [Helianthus annuus]KAJ0453003.1 putative adenosine/AMP deaminase active [Helianthus annuus]KAJ0474920.1 putative adenosine/AMP deaminase active [Helianthus annuus]KAJ0650475.1 putative adenosine/AMP deaminase active [Helianthus annuus]KAJ0654229.1 putative adenosine/AMP deaminase active [Helianthus annuus]